MKRILVLFLTLALALGLAPVAPALSEAEAYDFSVFSTLDAEEFAIFTDPNESVVMKEYLKAYEAETGKRVTLRFQTYTDDNGAEPLTLLLASNDYPDMIWYWLSDRIYPGAPDTLYDDKVFVDVTDMLPEYAPNFTEMLTHYPETMRRALYSAGGRLHQYGCSMPDINEETGEMARMCFWGPVPVRTDLLNQTGMKAEDINTFDDFTRLLRALKDLGVEIPMDFSYESAYAEAQPILGGYGSNWGFMRTEEDPNVIGYGPVTEGYRQWLELYHNWYAEGLLNPDFMTTNYDANISNLTAGKVGALVMHAFHAMYYYQGRVAEHPEQTLTALRMPVSAERFAEGKVAVARDMYGDSITGRAKYITSACENVEEAIRFIDFQYTPDMVLLANFGVEGTSFEYVDGVPEYTQAWKDDKTMFFYYQSQWLRGRFMNAQLAGDYKLDVHQDSLWGSWSNEGEEGFLTNLPNTGINFTLEEAEQNSQIWSELSVYLGEQRANFLLNGVTDEGWSAYLDMTKKLGMDDIIANYQAAYDRLIGK